MENEIKPHGKQETSSRQNGSSQIMRIDELKGLLKVSESTIRKITREGRFPRHIKISDRSIGWLRSDVQNWLNSSSKFTRRSASHSMKCQPTNEKLETSVLFGFKYYEKSHFELTLKAALRTFRSDHPLVKKYNKLKWKCKRGEFPLNENDISSLYSLVVKLGVNLPRTYREHLFSEMDTLVSENIFFQIWNESITHYQQNRNKEKAEI